ncbi:hypothetical protein [Chryseobacterium indologenes]|uniref:Uncharacterized protein n=1 Tax=Chryseobacterium indologenes TaxID=253 RepID=A0A0N0ZW16_CHRID|nr:hypothetical protein [Chryseobacterium indologenes]KPE52470.1 hypothetical protein AOB46_00090 [Chryseobacterium indologenes]
MKKMTEKTLKKSLMNSITSYSRIIPPGNSGYTPSVTPVVTPAYPINSTYYTPPNNGLPNNGWEIPK